MTARRRIVGSSKKSSVSTVLHRRRTGGAPAKTGMGGRVVEVPDGEDFTLKLLKKGYIEVNNFRSATYLHVSDLLGKCIRKMALSERLNLPMPAGTISESMNLTYAQGIAMHDYLKRKVGKGHPDKLFGRWACLCGNTTTHPMLLENIPRIPCGDCGHPPSRYQELELHDDESMVVGSPDITLYLGELDAYYPIEIKSMNYEQWKEIVRPLPDHIMQIVFYWMLMRRLGYSVTNQVSILYASKGFIFKSPYKEFVIYPEEQIARLDDYLEEARALKEAKAGGPLPRRVVCSSMNCREAKECHVAVMCFKHE